MKVEKYRDLTLLHVNKECLMAIACDSCGGIGLKEMDVLKTDFEVVGYFTACVVLCEILAFRAIPQILVNNFCVEMNPTGERLLSGIRLAVEEIGLDSNILLTGSTEENMPVVQTSIGLTCIGLVDLKTWNKPVTKVNDDLFVLGNPKVGAEVLTRDEISNLTIISQINDKPEIHEILPVGSKGIAYEVEELSKCNNLSFHYSQNLTVDINKSAGPVTCILVSGIREELEERLGKVGASYHYLGKFTSFNEE